MRRLIASVVTLALAAVMHLDWHVARPSEHHLSLGWSVHWLLAVPLFPLVAWYIHRNWPGRPMLASGAMIGSALLLAGVVEPAWELSTGATWDWAFGAPRLWALATFTGAGVAACAVTLALLRHADLSSRESADA